MAEKEPQFKVSDRRKFTLEGERRDEEETPQEAAPPAAQVDTAPDADISQPPADSAADSESDEIPPPTAAESAQQEIEYNASSRKLDDLLREANPAAQGAPAMDFSRLVQSIYMTAAVQMGAGADPNEQARVDIVGARQSIDMLGVLEEKTKGNLTEEEKRLLQSALFDLRMSFLDITNAIAKQAQQAPPRPRAIR